MERALVVTRHFCRSMSVSTSKMYQLIGAELSPYTAKIRCYLRYKNIPFESVQPSAEIYTRFIKPRVGWSVIPVLVTPEKQVIQDSTDIIAYLEKCHPHPAITPQTPKQGIVSLLTEMFADEWLVQQIMHYRWSFPENSAFLKEEFGRVGFPRETSANRSQIAEILYKKFRGMLPILGITEKTAPAIEQSFKELLDDLTMHFDQQPYLLGGKPCIGDFSLAGMTYAHLYRDPSPGYTMKTRSPLVAVWIEGMNGHLANANNLNLHNVDEDGWIVREKLPPDRNEFCPNDDIPETLFPILHRFFTEFSPVLLSTKKRLSKFIQENVTADKTKLPRDLGMHEYTIRGVKENRGVFPFNIWKWQHVTDFYQSLSAKDKKEVDDLLRQFPHGLEIVQANLNSCRVERIKNFLHAAKPNKSRL